MEQDCISGNSIASLSAAALSSLELSNCAFVLATRDKYLHNEHHTVHSTASELLSSIAEYAKSKLAAKSMVSCDASSYSLASHKHDSRYNKLSFSCLSGQISKYFKDEWSSYSSYGQSAQRYKFNGYPVKLSQNLEDLLSVGNFFVDGTLSTFNVPLSCVQKNVVVPWQIIEPYFGEVRVASIAAKHSVPSANVLKDSFDGWLWLDGYTEYPLSAFRLSSMLSSAAFIDYSTSTQTFKTKRLDAFIRCLSSSDQSVFQYVPASTLCISAHSHSIVFQSTCKISSYGTISCTSDAPGENPGNTVHLGNGYTIKDAGGYLSSIKSGGKTYVAAADIYTYNPGQSSEKILWNLSSLQYVNSKDNADVLNHTWEYYWKNKGNGGKGNYIVFPIGKCKLTCDIDTGQDGDVQIFKPGVAPSAETHPTYNDIPVKVYVGRRKDTV